MINMAKKFNFNKWREKYSSYSFKEQKEISNELEVLYPKQQQFNTKEVSNFLRNIPNPKILEIGGWKGELASEILTQNKSIILWHNYDICSNAIEKTVCNDKRYKTILLTDFAWNLDIFSKYNVCILSHVIEHIKKHELIKLFDKIKHIKYIYIDAPLNNPYLSQGWKNYEGTHVLECGWSGVMNMLKGYNLKLNGNLLSTSKQ